MQEIEKLLEDYTNAVRVAYTMPEISKGLQEKAELKVQRLRAALLACNPYSIYEEITEIQIGDQFRCIKSASTFDGNSIYHENYIYTSEEQGCITDDNANSRHTWDVARAREFFKKIKSSTNDSGTSSKSNSIWG